MKNKTIAQRVFNKDVTLKNKIFYISNGALMPFLCKKLEIVHVVEFPKCGGSWVRNMIRTYMNKDLFINNRLISKNDVILSHKMFTATYKNPVVVVRDPRDMYVSFYHYETNYKKRSNKPAIYDYFIPDPDRNQKEDFYEYLKAKMLNKSHPWFFYSQFVDSWVNVPNICLVRYEDCLKDAGKQLIKIMRHLDRTIDFDRIDNAVQKTSFKSITKEKYGVSRAAGDADNSKFHRKGIAGDWKNYFSRESCELFDKLEGRLLIDLGYESDESWIAEFFDK